MKVAIWDTYVTKNDGSVMHFDIVAPEDTRNEEIIYTFGKDYLLSKNLMGQAAQSLTAKECNFCHVEKASLEMEVSIQQKGCYIIEMENCN
jgi:hypothetical protein